MYSIIGDKDMKKTAKHGKPRLTIRIDRDLIIRIKTTALLENMNISRFIENILEKKIPKEIHIRRDK